MFRQEPQPPVKDEPLNDACDGCHAPRLRGHVVFCHLFLARLRLAARLRQNKPAAMKTARSLSIIDIKQRPKPILPMPASRELTFEHSATNGKNNHQNNTPC